MRRPALIPALVLLLAWPLQAAEPFSNAAEEEEQAQENAEQDATESNDESSEPEPGGDDPESASAAAGPLDGNGDFVPSVQISEDLSVSFPTDI